MIFVVVLSFDKIVLELLLWIRALLFSSDGYRQHIFTLKISLHTIQQQFGRPHSHRLSDCIRCKEF